MVVPYPQPPTVKGGEAAYCLVVVVSSSRLSCYLTEPVNQLGQGGDLLEESVFELASLVSSSSNDAANLCISRTVEKCVDEGFCLGSCAKASSLLILCVNVAIKYLLSVLCIFHIV